MTFTPAQLHWLRWLDQNGDGASLVGSVMVCDSGGRSNAAAAVSFLHLVVMGAVEIRAQRFYVSEVGRSELVRKEKHLGGYAEPLP
jgi:hypothetical protein